MSRTNKPKARLIFFGVLALIVGLGLVTLPSTLPAPDVDDPDAFFAPIQTGGFVVLGIGAALVLLGLLKK